MSRYMCVAFMFVLVPVFGWNAAAETSPEIEIQASKELSEEIRAQLDQQAVDASQIILTPLDEQEVEEDHGEVPAVAPEQDPSFEESDKFDSEPVEASELDERLVDEEDSALDTESVSDVAAPAAKGSPVEPVKPDYDAGVDPDGDIDTQDPDSDIETRDPDDDPDEVPARIDEDGEVETDDDDE